MLAAMTHVRSLAALALVTSLAAACGGLVKDTEKGIHTTEKEIKGSNGTKDVEQGTGTLKNDVTGKGRADAGPTVDTSPSPGDTKI